MNKQHIVVNSAQAGWHAGIGLDGNKDYLIVPSPSSSYTLNGGASHECFVGSDWMDGAELEIPGQIRLGGLNVLVWHHQENGPAIPQIISFPPGKRSAYANMGPLGGSMHFIIGDRAGTYGDNSGVCEVDVVMDDDSGVIKPAFPIQTYNDNVHKGSASWTVGDTGFVLCHMDGTMSGVAGSARFLSRLILVNRFGSPLYATHEVTLTVGADVIHGTHSKSKDFLNFPQVPADVLNQTRGAITQLARDVGDGDLISQAERLAKNFERLGKVYQTFKDSGIIVDIGIVLAVP